MKILVLEGSPHKKGSSNTLAEQFIKGAEEVGHNVKVLDVAHMNIHPCQGCGSCVQNDDMQIVEQKMRSADMVAFVSPIYYFGMSAQLKLVIDRFYSFNSSISGKGLKTVLIAAAWDSNPKTLGYLKDHYWGFAIILALRIVA